MDKAIERYLAKRGIHQTVAPANEKPFSERAPEFFGWFHHSVLGLDTEEYRRKFWREAYRTGHAIGHVPHTLDDYLFRRRNAYRQGMFNIFMYALLMGGSFATWVMRRQIDRHIRRLKRPGYYEEELARRKQLAEERRKLHKRKTINPCPLPEELLDAFKKAKTSPSCMIRFGSLLEDLECYVDNSIVFDEYGNIAGRKGGIRQYLANNVPELFCRYKTVMKYKALSKKFRQVLGACDPLPSALLLPEENPETKMRKECQKNLEDNGDAVKTDIIPGNIPEIIKHKDSRQITNKTTTTESSKIQTNSKPEVETLREFASVQIASMMRERAEKLLLGCEGTYISLMAVLEIQISPDYAPKQQIAENQMAKNLISVMRTMRMRSGGIVTGGMRSDGMETDQMHADWMQTKRNAM